MIIKLVEMVQQRIRLIIKITETKFIVCITEKEFGINYVFEPAVKYVFENKIESKLSTV